MYDFSLEDEGDDAVDAVDAGFGHSVWYLDAASKLNESNYLPTTLLNSVLLYICEGFFLTLTDCFQKLLTSLSLNLQI